MIIISKRILFKVKVKVNQHVLCGNVKQKNENIIHFAYALA